MPIKRHLFFFLTQVILLLFSFSVYPSGTEAAPDSYLLNIEESDFLVGPEDIPIDTLSKENWTPFEEFTFHKLKSADTLYLRLKVPSGQFRAPCLCLKIYVPDLALFCNNRKIYQKETSGNPYTHLILPLPEMEMKAPSFDLLFKIRYRNPLNLGEIYHLYYGEMKELMTFACHDQTKDFYSRFQEIATASLFLFLSLASLFVYFSQRRKYRAFLSFGLFSLSLGIKYSCDPFILSFSNITPQMFYYMDNISFLLVPAFLFKFVENIFFTESHKVIRRLWQAHLVVVFSFLILFMEQRYFLNAGHLIIFFLLISTLICWSVIFKTRSPLNPKIRMIFLGFISFFILMILHQILLQQEILENFSEIDLFGMAALLFTVALSYIVIEHYSFTQQKIHDSLMEIEKNKNEILRLERANIEAELEVLKNQVNPHFLFNTFNTLTSLIETKSKNASKFVQSLSRMYRYVLQSRMNELVSLEEEMEFVRSYLYILSKRFGDNLKIELNIPDTLLPRLLPPLSLQILIENAVKHNVISSKYPLTLRIEGSEKGLCVKNTLQKKEPSAPSTGIGLDNIKKRYQFFTDFPVLIEKNNKHYSATLPLIEGNKRDYENPDHRR